MSENRHITKNRNSKAWPDKEIVRTSGQVSRPIFTSGAFASRAFTLIDVLISISIIAVLIGLLIPSLASVNESARRVACQSNVRQIGLGLVMYANDFNGQLPASRFVATGFGNRAVAASPEKMVTVRVNAAEMLTAESTTWDGLGLLYNADYLPAAKVFYCSSHRGENPYRAYAQLWGRSEGEIVCNYHFRGEGPTSLGRTVNGVAPTTRYLWNIDPAQSSLLADGMQVRSDYNHRVGVNFFRADLTVHWFDDPTGSLEDSLPVSKEGATAQAVNNAWRAMDDAANSEANR